MTPLYMKIIIILLATIKMLICSLAIERQANIQSASQPINSHNEAASLKLMSAALKHHLALSAVLMRLVVVPMPLTATLK